MSFSCRTRKASRVGAVRSLVRAGGSAVGVALPLERHGPGDRRAVGRGTHDAAATGLAGAFLEVLEAAVGDALGNAAAVVGDDKFEGIVASDVDGHVMGAGVTDHIGQC